MLSEGIYGRNLEQESFQLQHQREKRERQCDQDWTSIISILTTTRRFCFLSDSHSLLSR